jgi:hypothetical protein
MIDDFPIEMLPIVHAGATKLFFVQSKAERADEPEFGPEGDASATDITRVLRYFRLKQGDVQPRIGTRSVPPLL